MNRTSGVQVRMNLYSGIILSLCFYIFCELPLIYYIMKSRTEHNAIMNTIKGKRILLVGNGPSALDSKNLTIDGDYDIIFRFNNYNSKDFSDYVGSRTDFVISSGFLTQTDAQNICFISPIQFLMYPIIVFISNFIPIKFIRERKYFSLDTRKHTVVLTSEGIFSSHTSGFRMMQYMLDHEIQFDYMGFDSLHDNFKQHQYKHYYADNVEFLQCFDKLHNHHEERLLFNQHKNKHIARSISQTQKCGDL